jgi:hypothetical protein
VIEVAKQEWERLFKEVLVAALRMTHTKDSMLVATHRDRAREATQRAFERCLRVRPAEVRSVDALRAYLVKAVRSELSHANDEQDSRSEREGAAAVEQATVGGRVHASAEVIHLDAARALRRRNRAALAIERLREELTAQTDTIALGTVDCIAAGKTEPADQAAFLECSVEEIYAARKRRKRVLEKILDALDDCGKEDA